jgi:hypothetical protein
LLIATSYTPTSCHKQFDLSYISGARSKKNRLAFHGPLYLA